MPAHKQQSVELETITPSQMVAFSSNDLIKLWESKHRLNVWDEIANAYFLVRSNKKISAKDKFDCAVKLGELALRLKRAGTSEKGGLTKVYVVPVDPTIP